MSDQLVRAITKDGFVKAVAVSTRDLTERARQIHHTLPVATAALGRTLAAASTGSRSRRRGMVWCRNKGGCPSRAAAFCMAWVNISSLPSVAVT